MMRFASAGNPAMLATAAFLSPSDPQPTIPTMKPPTSTVEMTANPRFMYDIALALPEKPVAGPNPRPPTDPPSWDTPDFTCLLSTSNHATANSGCQDLDIQLSRNRS